MKHCNENNDPCEGREDAARESEIVSAAKTAGREPERPSGGECPPDRSRSTGKPCEPVPDDADSGGSCPSNTNPQTRQELVRIRKGTEAGIEKSGELKKEVTEAGDRNVLPECPAIVCGIDWFELAGGIDWSRATPGIFEELAAAKRLAQETRQPAPLGLADCTVFVEPRGMGSGRDSHKEYCLSWRGVTIGISGRKHYDRRLHNFAVRVTGDPCLVVGVEDAWDAAWAIVAQLGGVIIDEWLRRLDVAVDLPEVSIRDELIPAIREGRFVTTAKDWQLHDGREGPTGFAFGKAPRVRVHCYDKKLEVGKRSPLYRQAMIDRRWGGAEPDAATRLEWQVGRDWFDEYGIDGASQAMAELPQITAKLTAEGPHPFLRLTDAVPDRENRHQDRAGTLPLWAWIGQAVREWSGPAAEPLQRISRERIDAQRLYQMVRGCLTSYADYRGEICEGIADAHRLLDVMHQTNGDTDQEWYDRWKKKAQASGTLADLYQFPPVDAA